MSDGVTLEWDSGQSPEELASKFDRLNGVIEGNLDEAMNTVVTKIAADASRKAPYETGWLSSNIRGVVVGWVGEVLEGAVGTKVYYAPYQEYGDEEFDVEFEGSEYLQDAIEENRQWAFEQFEQAIQDAVDEVFG